MTVTAPVLISPRIPSRRARRRSHVVTAAMKFAEHQARQGRVDRQLRPQAVWYGQHPLPDWHPWHDVRHEARSEVAHAATDAAWAEAPTLTTERDGPAPAAVAAPCEDQAMGQDTAAKERL